MTDTNLIALTSAIVSSYVEANHVQAGQVPELIRAVHQALLATGEPVAAEPETQKATAAQIRKSITPDGLYSFEDGRPYKTLKRHLTLRGLTPAAYREKWGLPSDYPTTAPAYSAARSALAKSMGLGAGGRKAASGTAKIAKKPRAKKAEAPPA
jgi:predicted transcriptional regulator